MDAKEFLGRYRRIDRRIDRLLERKARLFDRITSAPSQSSGGSSSGVRDKVGNGTVALIHYEERINAEIDRLAAVQAEIEDVLGKIDGDLAELLELVYLDGNTLVQAADILHYSYRQACRRHGEALRRVQDVLKCPEMS